MEKRQPWGRKKGRQVGKDLKTDDRGRERQGRKEKKGEAPPSKPDWWDQGWGWVRGLEALEAAAGQKRSSPARYKEWAPRPCPRVPGRVGDSCLSAAVWGGPAPPRASLCKAPAPARSASAQGTGQRGGVGETGGLPPIRR